MTDFISLQNVGAISQAVIPLSETGGVTVFRGRNGCGKSTGLETISTLASGRSKLPPLRDGEKLGLVSGFCSKIDLRLSGSRRGGNKPELVVDSIEGKFSISDLVNPNIKDPKAADNARLKALITLIGVDATPDLFATLFPTKEEFDTNVSKSSVDTTDPILMAERVKRDIEEKARIEEEKTRLPRRNPVVDDVEDLRNAVLLPILFRNLLWFDVFRFRRVGLELGRHHSNRNNSRSVVAGRRQTVVEIVRIFANRSDSQCDRRRQAILVRKRSRCRNNSCFGIDLEQAQFVAGDDRILTFRNKIESFC